MEISFIKTLRYLFCSLRQVQCVIFLQRRMYRACVVATELCAALRTGCISWCGESAPSHAAQWCRSGALPLQPIPYKTASKMHVVTIGFIYWVMVLMEPWLFSLELRHFKLCVGKIKVFALPSSDLARSRKPGEIHYGPKAVCKTSCFHLQFPSKCLYGIWKSKKQESWRSKPCKHRHLLSYLFLCNSTDFTEDASGLRRSRWEQGDLVLTAQRRFL